MVTCGVLQSDLCPLRDQHLAALRRSKENAGSGVPREGQTWEDSLWKLSMALFPRIHTQGKLWELLTMHSNVARDPDRAKMERNPVATQEEIEDIARPNELELMLCELDIILDGKDPALDGEDSEGRLPAKKGGNAYHGMRQ